MRSRIPLPALAPKSVLEVDLMALTPTERDLFWAGYYSGVGDGIPIGRRQAEDEAQASWAVMADRIRRMATTSVPFSQLAERRGEHDRAERAREHERRLGVTA